MGDIRALSSQLAVTEKQHVVMQTLLQRSAMGKDVSPAAEHVVRYILCSSSANIPRMLSLAYDLLTSIASNPCWVETLVSMTKALRSPSAEIVAVAMGKVPYLPHAALAHLALVATSPIVNAILHPSLSTPLFLRVHAIHAAAALCLRERPITATGVDPVRLDPLKPEQIAVIRRAVERSLYAILQGLRDREDVIVLSSLTVLTEYASSVDAVPRSSVLRAAKEAMAAVIWDLLAPHMKSIASRLSRITVGTDALSSVSSQASETSSIPPIKGRTVSLRLYERRSAIRGLARMAAHAAGGTSLRANMMELQPTGQATVAEANARAHDCVRWAVSWVDQCLLPLCDDSDWRLTATSCSSLLFICSHAKVPAVKEKRARWSVTAVTRLSRVLSEHAGKMSSLLLTSLTKDACRGFAAASKDPQATSKFISSIASALLRHAADCPRSSDRLEAISLLANAVVEFDLGGRNTNVGGGVLLAVTSSPAWRDIFAKAKSAGEQENLAQDSSTCSEVVCCFGQSVLDASRKIVSVGDGALRENLMNMWALMLAKLLNRTSMCLFWPFSSASSFAKEMFLKMFEALGQYAGYVVRSQRIGLEEYEQLQEMLVNAAMKQSDVNTRAALLLCVSRYWINSAMKAEANTGHVLKAIWKHAHEHYRDEEVMLRELRTGALWSAAQTGNKTPFQKSIEGGYISFVTALTKRTRAVVDTVSSTVTNIMETALFGTVALATAAAEGSTLTTDYAHSSFAALLALVHRNPTIAEKAIEIAKKYIAMMQAAESADLLVLESVQNYISAFQMYLDEFYPKPVKARPDALLSATAEFDPSVAGSRDAHAWLANVNESCVFATSRLDDPSMESVTVSTEEAVLHASTMSRMRLRGFHAGTLENREHGVNSSVERDQQTLNGAADPFGVVASHVMDIVKALVTVRIDVTNRSRFRVQNAVLTFDAAGALTPLPDAATFYVLGTLAPGTSSTQRVTLAVRHNQGFAGKVQFTIQVNDKDEENLGRRPVEQTCLPYYIPSSDVLLLRCPPDVAGVDVFRRRWDLMREASTFHVIIRQDQDVDGFVDTLERRSGCLKQVGRMRISSHVSAMVADSSRGDYIALAALAPEARGNSGRGSCLVYVTIRSNSEAYSSAFRRECRDWLTPRFKVVILDEDPNQALKVQALHPQDAYFSNDDRGLTDYQRWRAAHAARMACT